MILPPIEGLNIYDNFTVSPDEKIAVFYGSIKYIYIIDLNNIRIIDKITVPKQSFNIVFGWDLEGTYVLLTLTAKEVYKYVIPDY